MTLYNLVRVTSSTTGTGAITLGAALEGALSFADAGVQNGEVVSYGIRDGADSEVGRGTYNSGVLTRTTVLASTNSGSPIVLSGEEEVYLTTLAEDFARASGSEINTGTDEEKIVTPKAIADSDIAFGSNFSTPADGRLTLTSNDPVDTNKTGGTVYYTPFVGDKILLYDGSGWNLRTFAQLSIATAWTSGYNYDIFCYDNAGSPALESLVWTGNTTRGTALAYQDGVLVKSGTPTRRYLGTVRASAASTIANTLTQRYVWNMYHRLPKLLEVQHSTSHTYSGAIRLWNNSTTNNRLYWVLGLDLAFSLNFNAIIKAGASGSYAICNLKYDGQTGIGNGADQIQSYIGYYFQVGTVYPIELAAGYHYASAYEWGNNASSTFYGMNMSGREYF